MKNITKIIILLLSITSITLVGCGDWTDIESIDLDEQNMEKQNPELYAKYLKELVAYKASEHKVFITKFDNKLSLPNGQGERLSAVTDSVDYIILNNPDNLNTTIIQDMTDIKKKGTKTLYSIDFALIEAEYKAMLEEEESKAPELLNEEGEGEEEPEVDPFLDFCGQRMDYYISLYSKYNYDGINVIYNGAFSQGLPNDEKLKVEARQKVFFDKVVAWKQENPNSVMFFEGQPQNLLYGKEFLKTAKYITIPVIDAASADKMLFAVEMAILEGVPTDRFVFGVTIPLSESEDNGYFSELEADGTRRYAVKGAALIVASDRGSFNKAGVCVDHVQIDYYNGRKSYKNIRESITLMNPSI